MSQAKVKNADIAEALNGANGGTGVANTGKTITLGGNLTTSGAFTTTLTVTGNTNVTLPTSGTLLTTASGVTSVTGTANRITSTGGTTPVIDISPTFEALLGKVASPLSQFANTTSAQLAGMITDETGFGVLVFNNQPTLSDPRTFGGTATTAPLRIVTGGVLLTTQTANTFECDDTNLYFSNDSTGGRGAIPAQQYFRLTATGGAITTIGNYFGSNSNISLASGGFYEIEIEMFFLKTTAGTVTWTFTNSAAPTGMNLAYRFSPIGGIVSTAAATYLDGQQYNLTSTAPTVVTGSLTTGVNHYAKFHIFLNNSTGTSLKIQAACSAGSITPGIGSNWKCRRLPANSTGTFAA